MTKLKFIAPVLLTSSCMIALNAPASAQSAGQPDELEAIYACKSISDSLERLACYDNSVGRFEAAQKSGEVVAVSKTAIEKVKRDAFGFNIPSLPGLSTLFGGNRKDSKSAAKSNDLTDPVKEAAVTSTPNRAAKPPATQALPDARDMKEVTLDIRKMTEFGYKKTRFFMTNGQVWEQLDTTRLRIPKKRNGEPLKANISKAALGSFVLQINGKGSDIRVKRVR